MTEIIVPHSNLKKFSIKDAITSADNQPTGFGRWLLFVYENLEPKLFAETVADISFAAAFEHSFINNHFENILPKSDIDPANVGYKNLEQIEDPLTMVNRELFNVEGLCNLGLTDDEATIFRLLFDESSLQLSTYIFSSEYIKKTADDELADRDNKANVVFNAIKQLTAIKLLLKKRAQIAGNRDLDEVFTTNSMLSTLSDLSNNNTPINRFHQPSDFASELVDKEDVLGRSARYLADVLAAEAIKKKKLWQILKPLVIPGGNRQLTRKIDSINIDKYFKFPHLPKNSQAALTFLKPRVRKQLGI